MHVIKELVDVSTDVRWDNTEPADFVKDDGLKKIVRASWVLSAALAWGSSGTKAQEAGLQPDRGLGTGPPGFRGVEAAPPDKRLFFEATACDLLGEVFEGDELCPCASKSADLSARFLVGVGFRPTPSAFSTANC